MKVGHCQAFLLRNPERKRSGFFFAHCLSDGSGQGANTFMLLSINLSRLYTCVMRFVFYVMHISLLST